MVFSEQEFERVIAATVYDRDGAKVGPVNQLYLDNETGQPAWLTVNTGLFGTSETFVPVEGATFTGGDRLQVPYEKSFIKDAPRVGPEGPLLPEDQERLYRYYRLRYGVADVPTHDVGDTASMTAAEERLRVGKEQVETGRVRLRKYVTTEQETVTVPVEKEVLRVEREPVAGDTRRDRITGDEVEEDIVLREERPVVSKEVHETERVTIGKETVTEQERVADEVRKEHVEVEEDDPHGRPI